MEELTRYRVRSTDRAHHRTIAATSPQAAASQFLGQRAATLRLNCWSANGTEWHFDSSVKVGDGPFRMNRDAVKSIMVFVDLADSLVNA